MSSNFNVPQNPMLLGEGRMHSRTVLDQEIGRAERRVMALTALRDSLDWDNMTQDQEGALWDFFLDMCRR